MKIELLDRAEQDLADGAGFYEHQQSGLGEYFLDGLFSDIESLKLHGGLHAMQHGYHCAFSKRFPYAIYYRVVTQIVRVYAVLDCRQSPQNITARLSLNA